VKRKDYSEIVNKIVSIEQVLARGQRVPAIELTFKESGYNKLGGHKVYIDYECAKELSIKINQVLQDMRSKYFSSEYYDNLLRSLDPMLCK